MLRAGKRGWQMFAMTLGATAVLGWLIGCQPAPRSAQTEEQKPAESSASAQEQIERGKYLVTVMACNDCHTPSKLTPTGREPDTTRLLSGHPSDVKVSAPAKLPDNISVMVASTGTAFIGPWGVAYAANLTPDEETGIGIWDEQMFINAMRSGKHWGQGRTLAPIMPWHHYANLTDDDLKAIFAYLKSLPPIKNEVPALATAPGVQME